MTGEDMKQEPVPATEDYESSAHVTAVIRGRFFGGVAADVMEMQLGPDRAVLLLLDEEARFGEACKVSDAASRDYPDRRIFVHAGHLDPEGMTASRLRELGLERIRDGYYL